MKPTNSEILLQVFRFSKPFRKPLFLVFLIISLITAIEALNTYFLSKVFDMARPGSDLSQSLYWIGLATIFVLSKIFLVRFREKVEVNKLDVAIDNHLNFQSISKFFTFSNGQHINEHSGVKQSVVQNGFASIHNQINMFTYHFIPSIAMFLASIVVIFTVNVWFGVAYFLSSFFFAWGLIKFNRNLDPNVRTVRDIRNKNARFISEIYRFVFLIKNEVAESKSLTHLDKVQNNYQGEYSKTWLSAVNQLAVIRFSSQAFRWLSLFVTVVFVVKGLITPGMLFMMFLWSGNFINSVWALTDMQKQFINDKINIEKYFELLQINPDVIVKENSKVIESIQSIEFKDVHFAYPKRGKDFDTKDEVGEEYILKGINFKIEKGQRVAFVGESGSGKSTIANLLRRSFDPQLGQIKINDNDLKDIDLKSFLESIGSVDQEVILFDTSIRDNISFGISKPLTDEECDRVAKLSGVWKFKDKLEHGWDTIIGERGCKLSGGEKQRVGIARALAKTPQFLIFDEATSALDTLSEMEVQSAIEEVSKGKTSIIIAHRLSTVKDCDTIFVMKSGKILDSGTHLELLDNCDYYKELVKNQITEKSSKVKFGCV